MSRITAIENVRSPSPVIHSWMVGISEAMPASLLNSEAWCDAWRAALHTTELHEQERLTIISGWVWRVVLPSLQEVADAHGFGHEWRRLCENRSDETAREAIDAAAGASLRNWCLSIGAVETAAYMTLELCCAHDVPEWSLARLSALIATSVAKAKGSSDSVWSTLDPVGLLRELICVKRNPV
jgi:hypothetical protein